MKTYRLGLYEKAMPDSLSWEQKLIETHVAGFDWLEISVDESDERLSRLYMSRKDRALLRNQSFRLETPIHTMCLSGHRKYPLGSHDPAVRERSLDIMQRAIELSADLGVRIIQLAGYDVYYEEGDESTRAYFLDNLCICAEMAAQGGVALGFETMETPFMDTVQKAMHYVDKVQSPYLGVYPDIGNLKNAQVVYQHDLLEDIRLGKGHIMAAHLKETRPGVYRNMTFGTGHTEYRPCIQTLYEMGVRMFTGEFWYCGESDYQCKLIEAANFLTGQLDAAIENMPSR